MAGAPQPLSNNQKIVNADGTPTNYMIRWAQQNVVPPSRQVKAGAGLTGGGPLSSDVTISAALPGGFGTIDFTDNDVGNSLTLKAKTWTQITRNLTPSAQNFNLPKGPWENFDFYKNGLLQARAEGDLYYYNFQYEVTPTLAEASIRFAVQPVGFPAFQFGPGAVIVDSDAGVQTDGSVGFLVQARSRFVQNGGGIWVRLSCDGTLDEFSPEVTPLGYQP